MKQSTIMQKSLHKAKFYKSTPNLVGLPADKGLEVALVGRSNTGKSTTLNTICGQHSLARTSKTPGRTQHLVVFEIDEHRRLVDLPGFGYAKVSRKTQVAWEKEINKYLNYRKSLVGLVLIMDIRHVLQPIEDELLNWCAEANLKAHVLLNKADKLSRGASKSTLLQVEQRLYSLIERGDLSVSLFSGKEKTGCEDIWSKLADWFCRECQN